MYTSAVLGDSLFIILIVVALIGVQFMFRRRRRPEEEYPEIVHELLLEVRIDQALADTFAQRPKPRKFETVNYRRYKKKLTFLSQPLQKSLEDAYSLANDFNQKITLAKKEKAPDLKAGIDPEKLREPLAISKQGLEDWLVAKTGRKDLPPKYPSMLDSFLGGRG